ncbi:MAG: alpha/beta hydrolase [Polyangiaceae bacterium]|nr:alpha/beta hydrolase [Polyangiaceae bacterium]
MTETMAAELDGVKMVWEAVGGQYGTYGRILRVDSLPGPDAHRMRVAVELEKGTADITAVFAGDAELVSAVDFANAKPRFAPPSYVDAGRLTERALSVGEGAAALRATLVVPSGRRGVPAVLLVGGRKYNDLDGSVGRARIFRDVAEGLASRGIAVLRFDMRARDAKRMKALGVEPSALTIEHEYLGDVAAALATLRGAREVDPRRIFVAGHADGGWLGPWLLRDHPDVAGGILLAAPARHLVDRLVPEYVQRTELAKGKLTDLDRAKIALMDAEAARARDPALPLDTPVDDLPLGKPAAYWKKVQGYDAVATARALPQPLLILQGGRDERVTVAEDFARWKSGLGDRPDVEAKVYDALDHVLVAGQGPATPEAYAKLDGHVAAEVISDIADWVDRQASRPPGAPR